MGLFSPLFKVEKYVSVETCANIYMKSILISADQCELNLIVSTIKYIKKHHRRLLVEKAKGNFKNNIENSNVVPHRSTTSTRSCLTSMSRRVSVFSWLYGRSCYKRPYSLLWRLPLHTFIQRTILLFSQTMTPYRTYHYHSYFIKHPILEIHTYIRTLNHNCHHYLYIYAYQQAQSSYDVKVTIENRQDDTSKLP